MSVEKIIFNFSRPLPEPFDKLASKKVKTASKYAVSSTEATLNATTLKALLSYCRCMDGTALGAVGQSSQKAIAEYKSSIDPDTYHIVAYDPDSGNIMASIYNKNTEAISQYTLHKSKMDGSAILMAAIPSLLSDPEFENSFYAFFDEYKLGFPDRKKASEHAGILCDNAYRRVMDETCPAHIKFKLDASGNLTRISNAHLDSNSFAPTAVRAGTFSIFAQAPAERAAYAPAEAFAHKDFINQYQLSPSRTLTWHEQQMVPVLPPSYILPAEIINICRHAKETTGRLAPMRNFLLRGPAGTGKTKGAMAVAAGLGLPYMKYTCSSNTEVFDFIGQIFPDTDSMPAEDPKLDEERRILKEAGGMTYKNIAGFMSLPCLDDMDYDPAGVYKALSGKEKEDATSQECMSIVLDIVIDKVQKLSRDRAEKRDTGQSYIYMETDFIKALKNGYVIEIQEPSTIMQPGVLVGLNSLLEQEGSITLPTGEIIKRHPDAVVIITTNIDYEGCRGMNQSVIDRMNLISDIELPSPEIMAQRAISLTGAEDELQVSNMVKVVSDMADYCRKNGITDGTVGMRGLIDWIVSTEITKDPYGSALATIISRAASNEEDRSAIITSSLEPYFSPKRRKSI